MKYKHNEQFAPPAISTNILIPSFALIIIVFIAWSSFQQSQLFEKKLYNRVLATVAPTGINANAIEIDGRDVIIGLGYIQSPIQLKQINQLLVNLTGIANVYNKKDNRANNQTTTTTHPEVTTAAVTPVPPPAISKMEKKAVSTPTTEVKPAKIETPKTATAPEVKAAAAVVEPVAEVKEIAKIDLALTLSETVTTKIRFNFRTDKLTKTSQKQLNALVPLLQQHATQKIIIGGHTDNQGEAKLNQHLSKQRAESVVNYLIKKGVSSQQITAVGHGEMQPIATNKTSQGRKQNARITFSAGE